MQAALMVPCYIDMLYPHVGIATLELLEKLGVDVVCPKDQTCCGQPMANSGCYEEARATEEHCARVFGSFDCVVTPSVSCNHHMPSGSGDISGITVHPSMGVKTLTVVLSPAREAGKRTG